MTTANEAWIQNSLERLETLEQQRAQLAHHGGSAEQLDGLDEEIRTLYEALEAVADDSEDAQSPPAQGPAAPAAATDPSPFGAGPFEANPLGPAGSPFDAGPPAAGFAGDRAVFSPMPDESSAYDLDEPARSKGPVIIVAVAAIGLLSAGGWFFTQSSSPEAPAEPSGPAQVIKAGEIPDDTQEPDVARGASADRTEGTRFKESAQPARRPTSSSSRPRPSGSNKDTKASEKIEIGKSRDPLAGVK
jgi:hypothetical protein